MAPVGRWCSSTRWQARRSDRAAATAYTARASELRPGARLLSERALADYYGRSYQTVRRAMEVLRERELIVTIHGRGTFVAEHSK